MSDQTPTASAAQVPQQQASTPHSNLSTSENLSCQWQGCSERCPTAEQLYEHVCERHVGRKSTNNLNLTCQWGSCRTTTVKRDHITSHIRVHVPLKPHKCEFCGKAFKRPQDLKKHVKTHADDSVILRSPEPTGAARPNNVYNVGNGKAWLGDLRALTATASGGFYENPLSSVPSQGYHHGPSQYYQPQNNQHTSSYGNVYYAMNQGNEANHQAALSEKRGMDALNEFFGDLKRGQFNPASYQQVGQRLQMLQNIQLPLINHGAVDYQPMPAMVEVGGHGGNHGGPIAAHPYALPPMANLRTKGDLMNIDQYLEQIQSTVYDNDAHIAAAGVAQPGAHYVQGGMTYRSSHSPPRARLPSCHAIATAPMMAQQSSHSPQNGTPALTPPSSAQSFTSGHSPTSLPLNHHISQLPPTSAAMYPSLPAPSAQDAMAAGYPATTNAPASTLGGIFDNDERRRYSGGMLQRARPARSSDEMDTSEDSLTPPAKKSLSPLTPTRKVERAEVASNLIDPALNGLSSPTEPEETAQDKREEQWIQNVRVLEKLKEYIKERIARGEFENENENEEMKDVGHEDEEKVKVKDEDMKEKNEEESLYPVLKGIEAAS